MKKQTAVEWLEEQLRKRYGSPSLYRLVNQAKEMEKDQIKQCFIDVYKVLSESIDVDIDEDTLREIAQRYHSDTYKNTDK